MKKFVVTLALACFASSAAIFAMPADADTIVEKHFEEGPATVVDSWMQPTVVRTRAIKDADGTSTVVNEPLVLERHERVVVPSRETTVTTRVEPSVVRTEKRVMVSQAAKRSVAPRKAKKKHVQKRKLAHRAKSARKVASKRPARKYVASTYEEKVVERPAVVEQTESSVEKETIIERRHPALELY